MNRQLALHPSADLGRHGIETAHSERVDDDWQPFRNAEHNVGHRRGDHQNQCIDAGIEEAVPTVENQETQSISWQLSGVETAPLSEEAEHPPRPARGRGDDGRGELTAAEDVIAVKLEAMHFGGARLADLGLGLERGRRTHQCARAARYARRPAEPDSETPIRWLGGSLIHGRQASAMHPRFTRR